MARIVCVLKTAEGGVWLAPQAFAMSRRGHEVVAVLPRGGGRLRRELDSGGIAVHELDWDFSFRPGLSLLRALLELRRLLRRLRPDAVFYHLYASTLAARLCTIGMDVRRVAMVAGPLYLENAAIRLAERFLCRLDSSIIAGSRYTAERYHAIGRRRGVITIPYGVDTERFQPGPDERESLLDIAPNGFVAVMVAYVYAPKSVVRDGVGIKGHETLIDAWRRFANDHPDASLLLVGGGWMPAGESHRRQLVASSADVPSIRWVHTVEDVRPYYAAADLSISPSLSENHGAALEASAMGLPCLVSDAGALPETVEEGKTGWVVPAGDTPSLLRALHRAHELHQSGALPRMGAQARALVQERFEQRWCSEQVASTVLHGLEPVAGEVE